MAKRNFIDYYRMQGEAKAQAFELAMGLIPKPSGIAASLNINEPSAENLDIVIEAYRLYLMGVSGDTTPIRESLTLAVKKIEEQALINAVLAHLIVHEARSIVCGLFEFVEDVRETNTEIIKLLEDVTGFTDLPRTYNDIYDYIDNQIHFSKDGRDIARRKRG